MTNFLFAKNKTDFVDGTLKKPEISSSEYKSWMRCDAMIKGWLTTAMEKGIRDSVKYANTSSEIWSDLKERFGKENVTYAVNVLSQFVSDPQQKHLKAAIQVLRYLKGTPRQRILLPREGPTTLTAYCDSDRLGCIFTRRSTTGYLLLFSGGPISWKTKKQSVVSRSSAEAEYRAMASTVSEILWVRWLLKDMQVQLTTPTSLFCDNQAARHIANNPVYHERTKHVEMDYFFVREHVETRDIETKPIENTDACTSKRAQPVSKTLKQLLDQLYEKRGSTREAALSSIIQIFSFGYQHKFAEQNFTELLTRLLAINIGCGENGLELYKESALIISEALNTESNSKKLKLILDRLAIITFIGGNELEETERSMQSIWHFMHSRAHLKDAQSAAILSWSLLLSTMDSWSLSYKHWRGVIPFFKSLLEADHESTVKFEGDTSAPEEMKAETEVKENGHVSEISEGNTSALEKMNVQTVVKENGHVPKISEGNTSALEEMNVKTVVKEGHVLEISKGGTSAPEEVNVKTVIKDAHVLEISKCDTSVPEEMNVRTVVKDDHVPEISVKIGRQLLTVNTLPQQIQHNLLKRLLGSGFVAHMRENELLHDVFKFKPEKRKSGRELYVAERDEVGINLFVPDVIREENFRENGYALEICEVDTSALEKINVQTVVKVTFKSLTQ
nr:armadillo-type fold protein [Tanacetum cinerariifolium]